MNTKTDHYSIFKVGVVGGGVMGSGIAALVAKQDIPVIVKELNPELAQKTQEKIHHRFEHWLERKKINRGRFEDLKSMVVVTSHLEDLSDADLLIEAVPEKLDQKIQIFEECDRILRPQAVFASNTSALPVTKLGQATGRPDRVLGMHFFNPPTTMLLVELVKTPDTSPETLGAIQEFTQNTLQKIPIVVADRPGFVVNRLLMPYISEALIAIEESEVTIEEIDKAAVSGKIKWQMGPFTLLDFVGLNVACDVANFLAEAYQSRLIIEPHILEVLKKLGRLGKDKSGVGFYDYGAGAKPIEELLKEQFPDRLRNVSAGEVFERMMVLMLNEAVRILEENVASKEDIETGAVAGIGCPLGGPLHIIDEVGAQSVVGALLKFGNDHGPRFWPCQALVKMAQESKKFFPTE